MIVCIRGVKQGRDLSSYVLRSGSVSVGTASGRAFEVHAAIGKRMDTLYLTMFDPDLELAIPKRAEIIVYDADPASLPPGWTGFPAGYPIVDPGQPPSVFQTTAAVGTARSVPGLALTPGATERYLTSGVPTQRLFAGFVARATYGSVGPQRQLVIEAQDYTCRLRTTVCNRAYNVDADHPNGWSDSQIVVDLISRYRPEWSVTQVVPSYATTYGVGIYGTARYSPSAQYMPPITFPVHTLEQMLERIVKITRAYYRVDYYGAFIYGPPGSDLSPLSISDTPIPDTPATTLTATSAVGVPRAVVGAQVVPGSPERVPTPAVVSSQIACEGLVYAPDDSNFIDKVWVQGDTYRGAVQTYTLPRGDGSAYVFALPAELDAPATATVTVNGVDQGAIGVLGKDGTLDQRQSWTLQVLAERAPPTLAFKTTPPSGATIVLTGSFRYPLIQAVTDQGLQASAGGLLFEGVIRDRRMNDMSQAIRAAQGYLQFQGLTKKGGSCIVRRRGGFDAAGNPKLLQPGQQIQITNRAVFTGVLEGGATTTLQAIITELRMTLDETTIEPYNVWLTFADRPDLSDNDFIEQFQSEQARVNAAAQQADIAQVVSDLQQIFETPGVSESVAGTDLQTPPYRYGGPAAYGFALYS